ncbi:MAG TPA: DUF1549 domain-containing protein [Planctomycetota bacterium]
MILVLLLQAADFTHDVLPRLTKLGCNAGSCHGASTGQGGFRLSLLGFDPDADHRAIARELRGRRVDLARPDESLLLRKPLKKLKHGGGRALEEGSESHRVLRDWIAAGAPARSGPARELEGLEAAPGRVLARYSDGSSRDVTALALLTSNDDAIAADDGTVKAPGETSLMIRYGGRVAAVRVGRPFGPPTENRGRRGPIDDPINAKLDAFGLRAAPPCDDAAFLRRATLDAHGRLPSPDEIRAFDGDRDALVDRLVAAPAFDVRWGELWADVLDAKAPAFRDYVRGAIRRPWSETVRGLLVAEPHLYLRTDDPRALAETVGRAFLGARWGCAQCHNHPFERFSRLDYHGMAAYFARVRVRDGRVALEPRGEIELEGRPVLPPFGASEDRREDLARWVVERPDFARAAANRVWALLLGRGLVEPADDLRASNPATHPELLELLAAEFRKDASLPRLAALVMKSAAYARGAGRGGPFYDTRAPRPLDSRVLARAVGRVLGTEPPALPASGTLARTLALMNGPAGRAGDVEDLYLRTLSRRPTPEERALWTGEGDEYWEDLLWALLNSKEFGTNH